MRGRLFAAECAGRLADFKVRVRVYLVLELGPGPTFWQVSTEDCRRRAEPHGTGRPPQDAGAPPPRRTRSGEPSYLEQLSAVIASRMRRPCV